MEISSRYRNDKSATDMLAEKIIRGGRGNWGHREMIAHPQISQKQAGEIVQWILSLQDQPEKRLAREGRYRFSIPGSSTAKDGLFVFNASLADGRGSTVVFRPSLQEAEKADSVSRRFQQYKIQQGGSQATFSDLKDFDFIAFKGIDLRGIQSVDCRFQSTVKRNHVGGGVIEMRLDGAAGPLLGSIVIPAPTQSAEGEYRQSSLLIEQGKVPADGKMHDVFFVVKRDNAGAATVAGIDWVKFNLK
jgi:cytochrome c